MTTVRNSTSPIVFARIADGPLTPRQGHAARIEGSPPPLRTPHASVAAPGLVGASLRFDGVVRQLEPCNLEGGRERNLVALNYQTYDPMAERELLALSRDIATKHNLSYLAALHSRGRVAVGQISFTLLIESPHRAEALAAMVEFIDRLKQDIPIWKRPVWQ